MRKTTLRKGETPHFGPAFSARNPTGALNKWQRQMAWRMPSGAVVRTNLTGGAETYESAVKAPGCWVDHCRGLNADCLLMGSVGHHRKLSRRLVLRVCFEERWFDARSVFESNDYLREPYSAGDRSPTFADAINCGSGNSLCAYPVG